VSVRKRRGGVDVTPRLEKRSLSFTLSSSVKNAQPPIRPGGAEGGRLTRFHQREASK